jgi:hypothetical protein
MRAILHQPDFRELEATWRMLHFLVSQVETDETLKLYIIDISKAELAADLASVDALQSASTYRLLVEQSVGVAGAEPYAVLVGGYTFDQTAEDIRLLQQLARITQAAGAPLLAAADSHFAGCHGSCCVCLTAGTPTQLTGSILRNFRLWRGTSSICGAIQPLSVYACWLRLFVSSAGPFRVGLAAT